MALRVLLADESSTIKKVFQLALQDFAVEVKSVNLGVDVLPVAQKFQPDIIFADVLLQKQSGYEVSAELKKDDQLKTTPVILMWSGFMELDQDKFDASGANTHLEKPFDVQTLRQLIQKLVPKTQNQALSEFLKFPKMPEFVEKAGKNVEKNNGTTKAAASPTEFSLSDKQKSSSSSSPDDFINVPEVSVDFPQTDSSIENISSELESFEQVNLSGVHKPSALPLEQTEDEDFLVSSSEDENSQWEQEDLTRFQVNIPEDELEENMPQVTYPSPEEKIDSVQIVPDQKPPEPTLPQTEATKVELEMELNEVSSQDAKEFTPTHGIDSSQIEQIVKAQIEEFMRDKAADYLDEVIWKIVPELAERVIERELKQLLAEFEPPQYSLE